SSKIRLIKKAHGGNIGKNLNSGILKANGQVIAILGSDDIWMTNKISTQLKYISEFNIVCSNGNIIDGNNNIISEKYNNKFTTNKTFNLPELLEENFIIASSVIGYKKVFIEFGGFEDVVGRYGEDYFWWIKIAEKKPICYVEQNLVSYRVHSNNLSISKIEDKILLFENTLKIRKDFITSQNNVIAHAAKKGVSFVALELTKMYYQAKDLKNSLLCASMFLNYYDNKFSILYIKVMVYFVTFHLLKFLRRTESEK